MNAASVATAVKLPNLPFAFDTAIRSCYGRLGDQELAYGYE